MTEAQNTRRDNAVAELIAMLEAGKDLGEGLYCFYHSAEEFGLHVMDNHQEILAALSAAQPVEPVALDWLKIARAAGKHGVRYNTNRAFAEFLAEISAPQPVKPEGDDWSNGYVDFDGNELVTIRADELEKLRNERHRQKGGEAND